MSRSEYEFGLDARARYLCVDCGIDTSRRHGIAEYYMVRFAIWHAVGDPEGMLCVGCIEARLERKLHRDDFLECPVNGLFVGTRRFSRKQRRSTRLLHRMLRLPPADNVP